MAAQLRAYIQPQNTADIEISKCQMLKIIIISGSSNLFRNNPSGPTGSRYGTVSS